MLSLHYKCNFNCRHCYEDKFVRHDIPVSTLEEEKKIIDKCLALGILAFDFIGGESHLHPHFEELVAHCQPEKHYISLCTNGYGFTEKKTRHYLHLGIDKFNISLDSWYPDDHDSFRRKNDAHKNAMETIRLCRKVGMDITISVVVYRGYTQEDGFKKLVRFAIDNNIRLACKLAVPLGRWDGFLSNLVTEDDVETIRSLHEKHPFITRDIYGNAEQCCPAFKDFFTISAYGDVMPCNSIHVSFGSLKSESFKEIFDKVNKVHFFKTGYPGCPPAQDINFIKTYITNKEAAPYPPKAEDVFSELQKP